MKRVVRFSTLSPSIVRSKTKVRSGPGSLASRAIEWVQLNLTILDSEWRRELPHGQDRLKPFRCRCRLKVLADKWLCEVSVLIHRLRQCPGTICEGDPPLTVLRRLYVAFEPIFKFYRDLIAGLPSPAELVESAVIRDPGEILAIEQNGFQLRACRAPELKGKSPVPGLFEMDSGPGTAGVISRHLDPGIAECFR